MLSPTFLFHFINGTLTLLAGVLINTEVLELEGWLEPSSTTSTRMIKEKECSVGGPITSKRGSRCQMNLIWLKGRPDIGSVIPRLCWFVELWAS